MTSDVERYLLFSPNTGSFTASNLYKLLQCESGWDSETVKASDVMENSHGWWLDIYAPTDEEMRALGKVRPMYHMKLENSIAQLTSSCVNRCFVSIL